MTKIMILTGVALIIALVFGGLITAICAHPCSLEWEKVENRNYRKIIKLTHWWFFTQTVYEIDGRYYNKDGTRIEKLLEWRIDEHFESVKIKGMLK